ncbi:MAG: DUF4093 domain-containing protein [Eubacteriales bacterium]
MEKLQIAEAIVVEGRYDKNALSQVVDTLILETSGFGIFSNSEQMSLLRQVAKTQGLIVLTDGDGAGFLIRNKIISAIPKEHLKQAYIPDIYGKEKRKSAQSKEGKLGVEGMSPEVLREVLERAGASFSGRNKEKEIFTNTDFYQWGLTGEGSETRRARLLAMMGLPKNMSKKGMLQFFSACYGREEIENYLNEM